jgi:chromosome condensin MukBEF MukE localization factor
MASHKNLKGLILYYFYFFYAIPREYCIISGTTLAMNDFIRTVGVHSFNQQFLILGIRSQNYSSIFASTWILTPTVDLIFHCNDTNFINLSCAKSELRKQKRKEKAKKVVNDLRYICFIIHQVEHSTT